jgi:hypothetical protein
MTSERIELIEAQRQKIERLMAAIREIKEMTPGHYAREHAIIDAALDQTPTENAQLRAEIELLRAGNKLLRAALEPFTRNVESVSLSGALGHITREDLWRARDALKPPLD